MKTNSPLVLVLVLVLASQKSEAGSQKPEVRSQTSDINPTLAIRAIIGEAAGEGDTGMLAVAAAIRNRGHLRGVYGVKNPIAQNPSAILLKRAGRAWELSRTNDITLGATHWENVRAFGQPYWAKRLTVTTNIGHHRFYK